MSVTDDRSLAPRLAGGLALAVAAGHALPALAGAWPALRAPLGIDDSTASGTGYALTFDDGPHPQGTPAVLEILAAAGVQATFFLVGEQVERDAALAREVAGAGHHVGVHCQRHRNLLRVGPAGVREDLTRAEDVIAQATGRAPVLYRPPYGILNSCALVLARKRGWRTLLWSHWGRDWEARATAKSIAARATEGAGPGSVLLLHDADDYSAPDSWRRTVGALPLILEALGRRGLQPVAP